MTVPLSTSPRSVALLAGAGSAALLLGALGFQAAGYAPCELCILQRWPHLAAVIAAALIGALGWRRPLAVLGLLAALMAAALGAYHAGVELGWWQGPSHCSGGIADIARMSPADLMKSIKAAAPVRCDEVAWQLLGISMAGWNAMLSAGLAALWARSAAAPARR